MRQTVTQLQLETSCQVCNKRIGLYHFTHTSTKTDIIITGSHYQCIDCYALPPQRINTQSNKKQLTDGFIIQDASCCYCTKDLGLCQITALNHGEPVAHCICPNCWSKYRYCSYCMYRSEFTGSYRPFEMFHENGLCDLSHTEIQTFEDPLIHDITLGVQDVLSNEMMNEMKTIYREFLLDLNARPKVI
jgi:hypothetical protein